MKNKVLLEINQILNDKKLQLSVVQISQNLQIPENVVKGFLEELNNEGLVEIFRDLSGGMDFFLTDRGAAKIFQIENSNDFKVESSNKTQTQKVIDENKYLHQKMIHDFDVSELKTVCFYLGIDNEQLPNVIEKRSFARELISRARDIGKYDELRAYIEKGPD